MYMKSVAGSDGSLQVIVTFRSGTDPDTAAVRVQNRVSEALSRLPDEVRQFGVTTQKQSPTPLMYVGLLSKHGQHDALYLRNYAVLHVKDELSRLTGVGDVQLVGSGDYSIRVWLDPNRLAARGITSDDIVNAIREQNVQVVSSAIERSPRFGAIQITLTLYLPFNLEDQTMRSSSAGIKAPFMWWLKLRQTPRLR
jgi:multidrug efflux pump